MVSHVGCPPYVEEVDNSTLTSHNNPAHTVDSSERLSDGSVTRCSASREARPSFPMERRTISFTECDQSNSNHGTPPPTTYYSQAWYDDLENSAKEAVERHYPTIIEWQRGENESTLVSHVENLCLFFSALTDCKSLRGCISIILMQIKQYVGADVFLLGYTIDFLIHECGLAVGALAESGQSAFGSTWDEYTSQSSFFEGCDLSPVLDSDIPAWIKMLRDLKSWTGALHCAAFTKLSRFISMCSALGLCDLSGLTFDYNGIRLFSATTEVKHVTAASFFECLVDTVGHFIEGGWKAFTTGDVRYLLMDNSTAVDFETRYWKLYELAPHVKNGTLQLTGVTLHEYQRQLRQCEKEIDILLKGAKNSHARVPFERMKSTIKMWTSNLINLQTRGEFRKVPFGVYVWGGTGRGKSTLSLLFMKMCLKANGLPHDDEHLINLQADDKFQSNYTSDCNGIYLDDIANAKASANGANPTAMIINLINNIPYYAAKAEADQKGNCPFLPDVIVGNSNIPLEKAAEQYSNCPASITRRFPFHIKPEVKPEFALHDGRLSTQLLAEHYGDDIPAIPDCWNLNVYIPDENSKNYGLQCVAQGISVNTCLDLLIQASRNHFKMQTKIVTATMNIEKKIDWCDECNNPQFGCVCHSDTESGSSRESDEVVKRIQERNHLDFPRADLPPEERQPRSTGGRNANGRGFGRGRGGFGRGGRSGRFGHRGRTYDSHAGVDFERKLASDVQSAVDRRSVSAGIEALHEYYERRCAMIKNQVANASSVACQRISREYETWHGPFWFNWLCFVPDSVFGTTLFQRALVMSKVAPLALKALSYRKVCYVLVILAHILIAFSPTLYFCTVFCVLISLVALRSYVLRATITDLCEQRARMPFLLRKMRETDARTLIRGCAAMGVLYSAYRIYRATKKLESQGNLMPKSKEEIDSRDAEKNPWASVFVTSRKFSEKAKTSSLEQLLVHVKRNTYHMTLQLEDGRQRACDAFAVCAHYVLVPGHMLEEADCLAKFVRFDTDKLGASFRSFIGKKRGVHIPGTDFYLCYIPNTADVKDLREYFPLSLPYYVEGVMVHKDSQGEVKEHRAQLKQNRRIRATKADVEFQGFEYTLQENTFSGMCMAPWVSNARGREIIGFHLGGISGTPQGCCGSITKKELDSAFAAIEQLPTTMTPVSMSDIPDTEYDVQFLESETLHPKSPVGFLEKDSNLLFFGSVIGRAKYHSTVEETEISPTVAEVTGVRQQWGPPKFHKGTAWRDTLVNMADTAPGVPIDDLAPAVEDYLSTITEFVDKHPFLKEGVVPLDRIQTVSGIDGKRFIDAMKMNTSKGYPESGPKSEISIDLDPNDYPDHSCPRDVDEKYWVRVEEAKNAFLRGERANFIFKDCLKDEPTKLEKDKVRVFGGAPIAMQLLVRMYFLPLARVLSLAPVISEMGVGVNCVGPEGDQMIRRIRTFGETNVIAGDYKAYDTSMSSEITLTSFKVLIELARYFGYSEDNIKIMRGVAQEVCFPLHAFNGDLIMPFGTNPSGNNMTVYINCIVNSLYHRAFFYHLLRTNKISIAPGKKYKDYVALFTYGDDYKGSRSPQVAAYNNAGFQEYLARIGVLLTHPDKKSKMPPLFHDKEVDFLKRVNVYNHILRKWMAALCIPSMFKSLHCALSSKHVTNRENCMMAIDNFIRESFPWGEKIYEKHRQQMLQVAQKHDMVECCPMLGLSYKAYLNQYVCDYYPDQYEHFLETGELK